jgi:hypothetical protein
MIFVFAILCILAAAPTANAGFSFTGYFGKAYPLSTDLTLRQGFENTSLTFSGVEFEDRSFESPVYWGARLGYKPKEEESLTLEVEFIHYKVFADPNQVVDIRGTYQDERYESTAALDGFIQHFSISHGTNLLLGNVSGSKDLVKLWHPTRSLSFVGRFGVGIMILHAETEVQNVEKSGYQFGGFAYQGDVGLEMPIWRDISLISAYKLTQGGASIDVDRGTIDLNLTAQHLILGISAAF